jgi:hypothetical protein
MRNAGLHVDIPPSTFFSTKTPLLSPLDRPSSSQYPEIMEKPTTSNNSGLPVLRIRGMTTRRILFAFFAVLCLFGIGRHLHSGDAGATGFRISPFNYTLDAGHSIPGRLAAAGAKIKGLAQNTYLYPGPNPRWAAPNAPDGRSASPLVTPQTREIDIASMSLPLDALLSVRLDHWEASPGGRGPGMHMGLDGMVHEEMELGAFNAVNRETCGTVGHQMNTHMPQYASA